MRRWIVLGSAMLVAIVGCTTPQELVTAPKPSKRSEAQALLMDSMDRYAEMKTFHAKVAVTRTWWNGNIAAKEKEFPQEDAKREVWVEKPDHYAIRCRQRVAGDTNTYVCVSDGRSASSYVQGGWKWAFWSPTPRTIDDAEVPLIDNWTSCGSILYTLFRGPSRLAGLVRDGLDTIKLVGEAKLPNGETARIIAFVTPQSDERTPWITEITIGVRDHLVYSIKQTANSTMQVKNGFAAAASATRVVYAERYFDVEIDRPIPPGTFDTQIPPGIEPITGQP